MAAHAANYPRLLRHAAGPFYAPVRFPGIRVAPGERGTRPLPFLRKQLGTRRNLEHATVTLHHRQKFRQLSPNCERRD